MKKIFLGLLVVIAVIGGIVWYVMSGANEFLKSQIEEKGSQYLGTTVSVSGVDLIFREGRLEISELEIDNPEGFSNEDALSVEGLAFDLGNSLQEPYHVQELTVNAPEMLYELNADGTGNLMVLKNNLQAHLPENKPAQSSGEPAPLVIVDSVTVANTKLTLDFEKFDTKGVQLNKKTFEVTLPTFNAGPIGQPDGMPADQVGAAIINNMLDNVIAEAKKKARDVAKEAAKEKFNEEKDKLLDKADEKIKDILNKDF
ncbi:DUF4230 domain-containing protein [Alteromonas ponticola]|uniref:AsmA domain-containing protein n=1 Tax=Alteromonas ponticola TaxID=2720613 RepID=A0ABX1R3P6_9ALTE|nr:DUF4230 domain-containing protein [Alteromonas ponticola]NMH60699.1 hypothetical protein [Alteromonas ponticola]